MVFNATLEMYSIKRDADNYGDDDDDEIDEESEDQPHDASWSSPGLNL